MLPGTNSLRAADEDRLRGLKAANQVGDETVFRPVATTNNIAGPRRRQGYSLLLRGSGREERTAVGRADDFRAGFARCIGVVAAQFIRLSIRPYPFLIAIALVRSDRDHSSHAGGLSHRLQNVNCSHNIGRVGAERISIGAAHQRLRGKVENYFGAKLAEGGREPGGISNVAAHVVQTPTNRSSR